MKFDIFSELFTILELCNASVKHRGPLKKFQCDLKEYFCVYACNQSYGDVRRMTHIDQEKTKKMSKD
jgi:hypothetical protein